jgi:Peptidase A4 family
MLVVVLLAMTATASADKPSLFPGATRAAGHGHRDIVIRERHGNQVTSSNWSGYAVTTAKDSVSDVKGSWIVPAVTCNSTDAYAAFWVGIDGYGSSTVEQIGTDSDCVNGKPTYYAWFEFYPHFSYNIDSVAVKPGDVISAEVNYTANGRFAVSISVNGGPPFSTSTKLSQATRSSAEWIIEAVWGGGVLPLADFNSVSYGADHTAVSGTCDATVGKTSNPIGSIAGDVLAITMTADNGATKSQPLPLSADQSSFIDTWHSAGP